MSYHRKLVERPIVKKLAQECRDKNLAALFNALSENKLGKAKKELTNLVIRFNEDPEIVKPVMATLDELAMRSGRSDTAKLAKKLALKLDFGSKMCVKLLGKANEIEERKHAPASRKSDLETMTPNEFTAKLRPAKTLLDREW